MKLNCNTKLLGEAVFGVSRAVSPNSAVPALQGILLKADGFKIELTGYDMEMAISTSVEANVTAPGEIVLPAKLFGDMLKSLSGEEVYIESEENFITTIKSGITEYSLSGINAADFPEIPAPGADFAFEIDSSEFAGMVNSTIYAVSTDDKKPAHTGELLNIEPGEITIVALDGFRLAITRHPVVTDRDISVVVPAKTMSEVSRLIGESGEALNVDVNKRYIVFSGGKYTVMSRLIEGEFLNYKSVLPEDKKTTVTVDVMPFEKVISRCSVIITERLKNPLRVSFCESEDIDIRCQTPLGSVRDKLSADTKGEKVEIGFNYRYLLDALRNSGCDKVIIELNGPLSPVKIMPAEGDDFLFLVLPVRFKNE